MNFDRVAPHYALLERLTLGSLQQRARTHFLAESAGARHALLVGEGDGRFLAAALAAWPAARFTVVEASARMLEQARRAAAGSARVEFVQARLPEWAPASLREPPDLVVTNFFFDCFAADALEPIVASLARAAARETTWLVAEFTDRRTWRNRLLLGLAYAYFRRAAGVPARWVPAYAGAMERSGFVLRQRQVFARELLHAELWRRER